jgi:aminodeoxyfutalosine synthase
MSAANEGTMLYDTFSKRIAAGERLNREEIHALAAAHDILTLGMLADEARRRAHGNRVTFARVACCAFDKPLTDEVPVGAREVRLTGAPPSIGIAMNAVAAAKAVAGERLLSGFSLLDLATLSNGSGLTQLLRDLRNAGLEMVGEVPVDKLPSPELQLEALAAAGFDRVRLTMAKPAAEQRFEAMLRAVDVSEKFSFARIIAPLPMSLPAFRPTTGYDDVKVVALARLAAQPGIHIQVDWQRYGPKLAQVALTFGADDLDNVSASDDAPEGRRRAPIEEVRRNIEAAGFTPVERDGRWNR